MSLRGRMSGRFVSNDNGSYLELTVYGNPGDSRNDDIRGTLVVAGRVRPNRCLHLIDVRLALDNLLGTVHHQGKCL